jgi:hypothetical protein
MACPKTQEAPKDVRRSAPNRSIGFDFIGFNDPRCGSLPNDARKSPSDYDSGGLQE